jgi:hypothetical protein
MYVKMNPSFKSILVTLGNVLTFIAAVIAIVDFFLPDKLKLRLEAKANSAKIWLENYRIREIRNFLWSRPVQITMYGIYGISLAYSIASGISDPTARISPQFHNIYRSLVEDVFIFTAIFAIFVYVTAYKYLHRQLIEDLTLESNTSSYMGSLLRRLFQFFPSVIAAFLVHQFFADFFPYSMVATWAVAPFLMEFLILLTVLALSLLWISGFFLGEIAISLFALLLQKSLAEERKFLVTVATLFAAIGQILVYLFSL